MVSIGSCRSQPVPPVITSHEPWRAAACSERPAGISPLAGTARQRATEPFATLEPPSSSEPISYSHTSFSHVAIGHASGGRRAADAAAAATSSAAAVAVARLTPSRVVFEALERESCGAGALPDAWPPNTRMVRPSARSVAVWPQRAAGRTPSTRGACQRGGTLSSSSTCTSSKSVAAGPADRRTTPPPPKTHRRPLPSPPRATAAWRARAGGDCWTFGRLQRCSSSAYTSIVDEYAPSPSTPPKTTSRGPPLPPAMKVPVWPLRWDGQWPTA
eukprot:jgi/Chrpa1/4406/Chrysochromulina_OHIO_Genome00012630-RA